MILAVDVAYAENTAKVAGVLFRQWDDSAIDKEIVLDVEPVAPYVPGQFYLRELPCIVKLLAEVNTLGVELQCIVIDGYVTLGADAHAGLGMHLWEHLHGSIPVVGVAKTEFFGTPDAMRLRRGDSTRDLFVSSVGMPLEEAKAHILSMTGKYRLPDFLKKVDQLCRGI